MEWLFRSELDTTTTIALWSIAAVLVTTVVLFVYTMGLRYATIVGDQRRRRFREHWREVFAAAALCIDDAQELELPKFTQADHTDLLEEWNRARSIVDGSAAANLIVLAQRAGIPQLAAELFQRHRVQSRIMAVQTFGHLQDKAHFNAILELLDDPNTALSITAATSLIEIDAARAILKVVPMIRTRRDWPKNKVSILLREAGSELISEPMYRVIRSAESEDMPFLLQFARLVENEVRDALVEELIRESNDPGVLTAALKLVSGYRGVPRIAALTQHKDWIVRMQAAKVLGRVGQREHLGILESLLDDPEWWVRYRAAQSISSLPFLGPNELRALQERQTDRFAVDILQQSFAEVGLA
ncbi:MAG: HEAT repeat domain-containing protein [Gammaproteobacteria bacterium]|nr:HEAT repeat domain-containing protein [Gammaproteobacteria bacterium]